MKQLILLTGLSLLAGAVVAQSVPKPKAPFSHFQQSQHKTSHQLLMQRLHLTSAQKEQLKKEQDKALEKVLTLEQKATLGQFRQKQQAFKDSVQKRQDRKLKERLGISQEQVTKLRDMQRTFRENMKANQEDLKQSVQQQRDRTRELWQAQQKAFQEMFSKEQLEKYKMLMQAKMQKMRQLHQRGNPNVGNRPIGNRPETRAPMGNWHPMNN